MITINGETRSNVLIGGSTGTRGFLLTITDIISTETLAQIPIPILDNEETTAEDDRRTIRGITVGVVVGLRLDITMNLTRVIHQLVTIVQTEITEIHITITIDLFVDPTPMTAISKVRSLRNVVTWTPIENYRKLMLVGMQIGIGGVIIILPMQKILVGVDEY